jgi:hypothetical protein
MITDVTLPRGERSRSRGTKESEAGDRHHTPKVARRGLRDTGTEDDGVSDSQILQTAERIGDEHACYHLLPEFTWTGTAMTLAGAVVGREALFAV